MGVVKVPYLDKLSEPQVSAECNHENPVRGIYYICTVTLRTSVESFIDTYQHTSRGRKGLGGGGKMAKMNAWEGNVSKTNCLTKVL